MTGLDKINGRIIAEAEADAEKIIAEAKEKCNEIEEKYKARAEEIKEKLVANAEREGEGIITRAKSSATMAKRNALLEAKSKLIDDAFAEAEKTILEWDDEKYCDFLVSLLSGALLNQVEAERVSLELYGPEEAQVCDRYEVVLCERDRKKFGVKLLEDVRRSVIGKLDSSFLDKLVLSDATRDIKGGVILKYGDIESNCSLATLFEQVRERLESDVNKSLFGEEDKDKDKDNEKEKDK